MLAPHRAVNLLGTALFALTAACGAASTQSTHVSSPTPHPSLVSLAPLTAATFAEQLAPRQSLALVLPEANLWRTRNQGTYYRATHDETASELWVKRWRQGEVVGANQCAAQSALWRPDLTPPNEVSNQTPRVTAVVDAPPGYQTRVQTSVWQEGETWHAQLTAIGAAIRECFVYVYRTRAPRSPLGRAVLAQRLDVMGEALAATRVTSATVNTARASAP